MTSRKLNKKVMTVAKFGTKKDSVAPFSSILQTSGGDPTNSTITVVTTHFG